MKRILQTLMGVCQATVLVAALGFGVSANANEGGFPLDAAPNRVSNNASLQNGAKIFVNYCLNCHSATSMRYNRLRDIGLTDQQIKDNLILTDAKVGDLMTISMTPKEARLGLVKLHLTSLLRLVLAEPIGCTPTSVLFIKTTPLRLVGITWFIQT